MSKTFSRRKLVFLRNGSDRWRFFNGSVFDGDVRVSKKRGYSQQCNVERSDLQLQAIPFVWMKETRFRSKRLFSTPFVYGERFQRHQIQILLTDFFSHQVVVYALQKVRPFYKNAHVLFTEITAKET